MEVVRIPGPVGSRQEDRDAPVPEQQEAERAVAATPDDLPLVLVTWRDAWFDFDGEDAGESRPDYLVTTVGFVLRDGPRFLSLAQEVLPDGDGFRAVTHIPRSVVESIVPIVPVAEPQPGLYSAGPGADGVPEAGRRDA
jgi:hypothetical protein